MNLLEEHLAQGLGEYLIIINNKVLLAFFDTGDRDFMSMSYCINE